MPSVGPFKLTFTGFFGLLLLWQQHDTVPMLYTSAACPDGPTDYHARFPSPPFSLSHPLNRNLQVCFVVYCSGNNTARHPQPTRPQWLNCLPCPLITTPPLTLPTWKARKSASVQGCPWIDPRITRIRTVMTRAYTDHSWQVTRFPRVTHCG